MNDQDYDLSLNIKTGEDFLHAHDSIHYHPYEPTPYHGLEILFNEYEVNKQDCVVDFGCGKGRLNFYVHHRFQAKVVGIEMNKRFYQQAIKNLQSYRKKRKVKQGDVTFHCCLAEEYPIEVEDNKFYFFNPFSIKIFRRVINHILMSKEKVDREIDLIMYYGADEYIDFLERETLFQLHQEIIIPGFYPRNPYERFLIYRLK
ncbi:class I SAM-dependent methyltransferase [Niallia sp. XMNu-256]|uniref:class I SAM-dependent methyltransferase n=1 Tax=Niallia sp. XMNu-256 TaxID=3082444 RepID=UPI0030D6045C